MDQYVGLAKDAITEYVKNKKIMAVPEGLAKEFYDKKAGVFVTLFADGELRGCIGTFLPARKNIAEEIIENAILTCSEDSRFLPVAESELERLNYEVSILSCPEPVPDLAKHNPKTHGLIVSDRYGRRGLLLPDLEGVNSASDQVKICCRKGGIDPDEDGLTCERFTVEKHK